MNIIDNLVYSMLSYSRNYQPYVYSWGKRVGRDIVQERLHLEAMIKLRSKNIFEQGIFSGVMEELTSKKIAAPRMRYSKELYMVMKNKSLRDVSDTALLKAAYPHLYMSPGSHTLLYWIGKESGARLGLKHRHSLAELKKISDGLNIGDVEVSNKKIILKGSVFAEDDSGKMICSYYAGFAAGFLSSKEKKVNVLERKCKSHGDKKCEFILT